MAKCPRCCEEIKFDPKCPDGQVKKCPHCLEFIHPENFFDQLCKALQEYLSKNQNIINRIPTWIKRHHQFIRRITVGVFYGVLIWVAVPFFFNLFHVQELSAIRILALIAAFTVTLAWIRPANTQPTVLIAFMTLLMIGLGSLWQKENFELRNRPYIQILQDDFKFNFTGKFRLENLQDPEPEFTLDWSLINHGPVPARIKNIRMYAHSDKEKLKEQEAIQIGPDEQDKLSQWISQDVFPAAGRDISNEHSRTVTFYLNVDDIDALFGVKLDEEKIFDGKKYEKTGIYDSDYLKPYKNKTLKKFYHIVQLEYHALGESHRIKQPYWYWLSYEHENKQSRAVDSGISRVIPENT